MRAQRRREAAASSLAEGMRQRQQAQGAGPGAAAEDRGGAGAAELAALNKEVGELRSALAEAKQAALAAANPPPPPPDKPPPVGDAEAGPLLVIAVNTIPRPSDEDYLMQALDSISAQLKEGDNSVAVYVLNLRPGKHAVFAAAQKRYAADGR